MLPHTLTPVTEDERRDAAAGADEDVTDHAVLVFSSDAFAAALLGAAIELAGLAPLFPQANEAARAALMRVRPQLVVIDCDHEDACSDAFVGPALMTGSRLLLVRSHRTQRDIGDLAERIGVTVLELPVEQETLTRVLHELVV